MSAMEQPLRPAKTFEDAVATLRSWQSKLRIVLHDLNARPEPFRLYNSILPLIDSLTHHDAYFSYSVSFLTLLHSCSYRIYPRKRVAPEWVLRANWEQAKKRRQQSGASVPQDSQRKRGG